MVFWASQVAQWQRIHLLAGDSETGTSPWVRKMPWSRKRPPVPLFLPGKSHGHSMGSVVYGVTKSWTQLRDCPPTHSQSCVLTTLQWVIPTWHCSCHVGVVRW